MTDTRTMIEVRDLKKHYGEVRAVDGISFAVSEGEIFGLLGHNGAGKTTTIRMLTGRTRPTDGTAFVAGFDVAADRDKVKPLINLVFEDQNLYERLSGRENLTVFANLYGVPQTRADELLEQVSLTDAAKRKVKTYSSGMKQRLLVARALINGPRVLFLDEPTRGLDPTSARDLRELIARLSAGQIVALATPRELKLRYGSPAAAVLLRDRTEHTIRLDDPADATKLESWMTAGDILTIHSQEGTLEDVFVALAGRPL